MSQMKDIALQIHQALDAEGGITVADIVLGLLQELPVSVHDGIDLVTLSSAIEDYAALRT